MNQHDQMRKHIFDLYNAVSKACGDDEKAVKATIKSQGGDYKAIKQALAAEPASLVRLNFEQIEDCFPEKGCYSRKEDGALVTSAQWLHDFAHAIMDAMERVNGAHQSKSGFIDEDKEKLAHQIAVKNGIVDERGSSEPRDYRVKTQAPKRPLPPPTTEKL